MIKAIFFDAAGILYTRGGHTEEYALNLLQKNGFSTEVKPDQYSRQMELKSQANEGAVSHDVYWDQFLLMRGVLDPHYEKSMPPRSLIIRTMFNPFQAPKKLYSK